MLLQVTSLLANGNPSNSDVNPNYHYNSDSRWRTNHNPTVTQNCDIYSHDYHYNHSWRLPEKVKIGVLLPLSGGERQTLAIASDDEQA